MQEEEVREEHCTHSRPRRGGRRSRSRSRCGSSRSSSAIVPTTWHKRSFNLNQYF